MYREFIVLVKMLLLGVGCMWWLRWFCVVVWSWLWWLLWVCLVVKVWAYVGGCWSCGVGGGLVVAVGGVIMVAGVVGVDDDVVNMGVSVDVVDDEDEVTRATSSPISDEV